VLKLEYMIDLSVIILSYNTKDLTQKCLDSLFASLSKSRIKSQVIVLDNASQDTSVKMLQEVEKTPTTPTSHIKLL